MKKVKLISLSLLISIGLIGFSQVNSQSNREVQLNSNFEIDLYDQVKLVNYPVYLTNEAVAVPNCFAPGNCPGASVSFRILYPSGSKSLTLSEGESASYKGASMRLVKVVGTKATVYATASTLPHMAGTNVKDSSGTVWFITEHYTRRAYPSVNIFLSYKFNSWDKVVDANTADLSLPVHDWAYNRHGGLVSPRSGSLFNDNGTIYISQQWMKAGFTSNAIFSASPPNGFNYSYSNVYPADVSYLTNQYEINNTEDQHPEGTLINDNGTFYIMGGGGKYGIPSKDILDSWGYWLSDAVPANSFDRNAPSYQPLGHRPSHKLNVLD